MRPTNTTRLLAWAALLVLAPACAVVCPTEAIIPGDWHDPNSPVSRLAAELNLSVREDRILFNKDPVHINPDREEGLPFVLYRNAFRRIVSVKRCRRELEFADVLVDIARYDRALPVCVGHAGVDIAERAFD